MAFLLNLSFYGKEYDKRGNEFSSDRDYRIILFLITSEKFSRQLNPATRNTTGLPRPSLISYDVGD